MLLLKSLRKMVGRTAAYRPGLRRPPDHHPRHPRLDIEALEDRMLLSAYAFTPIADTGPDSPYSRLGVGQAINDLGAVAFHATLRTGGEAIFRHNGDGSLTTIATTGKLISTFTLSPYMNESGTVSFGAALQDGSTAIFMGSGQELTRIADTGPNSPFSALPTPAPRIHADGTVYFHANLTSGGRGFFVGDGGLPRILYVTGGQFSAFPGSPASQVNGYTVAFRATLQDGTNGVFTGSGGPTTTLVTSGSTYRDFIGSEINDAGRVAFSANLTEGGQAIVIAREGTLTTFVDTSGPFSQFFAGRLSINNPEMVVFGAELDAGGYGLFQGPDPVADKIIAIGDPLFGSTVVGFPDNNHLNPRGLNNAGQLIFRVDLADGRRVVVRGDPCTVSLVPSQASPQLVGEPITWTATTAHCHTFTWAPLQEGAYSVKVTVKESYQAVQTTSTVVPYQVNSRVTGSGAVITPTSNPLVALYSVPPSSVATAFVEFRVAGDPSAWRTTNTLPVVPGKSTNFFVAGMLPNTTYQMRHVFSDGTASSPLLFTTGSAPATLTFPTFTVRQAPGPESDLEQDLLFHQFASSPDNVPNPLATDLSGRVVWYYDVSQSGLTQTFPGQSLVPGGTVLVLGVDRYAPLPGTLDVLREIDLAGNVVRETNMDAVNPQPTALGFNPIFRCIHDVQRLPNEKSAVIGSTERRGTINGTRTDYVGMAIVVLDQDFQVVWAWNALDHLA